MDETRKRMNASASTGYTSPVGEDVQFTPPPPKKRFVNGGSVPTTAAEVPSTIALAHEGFPDQDGLENFQKQAIWRQMQEYKRQCHRLTSRQSAQESARDDALARAAVVEGVWRTLMEEISQLTGSGESKIKAPGPAPTSNDEDSDVDWQDQDLESLKHVLSRYAEKTRTVIAQLAHFSGGGDPDKVHQRLDHLHRKAVALRAQARHSKQTVLDLKVALEEAQEQLREREKQADRLSSSSVTQVFSTSINRPEAEEAAVATVESQEAEKNASERTTADTAAAASTVELETMRSDFAHLTSMLNSVQAQLALSEKARAKAQADFDHLQVESSSPSLSQLTASPLFQDGQRQVVFMKAEMEKAMAEVDRLGRENESLRSFRAELFEVTTTEHKAEVDHLRKEVESREGDVTRLRNSRDILTNEVGLLKGRLSQEIKQIEAAHNLARANQDRIASLQSEVWRSKLAMAFQSGNDDSVQALMNKIPVVEKHKSSAQLRAELAHTMDLETELSNCKWALQDLSEASSTSVDLVLELAKVKKGLSTYQVRFGSKAIDQLTDEDLSKKLAQAIEAKEEAESQAKVNESMLQPLIKEVENLSTAWSELEGQMRNKVFNLTKKEDEIAALRASKTRADHKYFDECKTSSKLKEEVMVLKKTTKKQDETVIKLNETLQQASHQTALQEKEATLLKQALENRNQKVNNLTIEISETKARLERSDRRGQEISRIAQERTEALSREQLARVAKEEEARRANQILTELKSSRKTENDSAREAALADENDKLKKLLKCGACLSRFKSHTLLKCMHLFCKQCIDDRVSSRQRKCPQCGLAFSTGDIAQVYL